MRARITIFKVFLIVIFLFPVQSRAQERNSDIWLSIFFTGTITAVNYFNVDEVFHEGDSVTGTLELMGPGYPVYNSAEDKWKIFFSQPPQILLKNDATGAAHEISAGPQWAEAGGQTVVDYEVKKGSGKLFLIDWGYQYLDHTQFDNGWSVCSAAFSPDAPYSYDYIFTVWFREGGGIMNQTESYGILMNDRACTEGYLCDQTSGKWPGGPPDTAALEALIIRLYKLLWLIDPVKGDIDYWWTSMLSGKETVQDLLDLLLDGSMYLNRNLGDQEYLETIYEALFGKDIRSDDLQNWLGELGGGSKTRDDILNEILRSDDFQGLCARMGISATPGNS